MNKEINLLIIDDDQIDRECYKRLLIAAHDIAYRIFEAETGVEGLEYCLAGVPDCILLDYSLTDMDGIEFLDRLANSDGEVTIPVIMLTGQGNEGIAVKVMKHGVKDYMVKKGISSKELNGAISAAIRENHGMLAERGSFVPSGLSAPPINWRRV